MATRKQITISFLPTALVVAATLLPVGMLDIALHETHRAVGTMYRTIAVLFGLGVLLTVTLLLLRRFLQADARQSRFQSVQKAIAAAQSEILSEVLGASLEPEALLGRIAALACELTGGSGAAVELVDGETLVHQAVSGKLTLPAGSRRSAQSSSSGLCVRTGQTLSFADAAHDPRVDKALCQTLGVGAILLTPLRQAGVCVGVLRVVAAQAQAFSEQDERTLQMLADFAGLALSRSAELVREQALVAERTEALRNLEESQTLFWAALNAMRDGFAVQDQDGKVLRCNDTADRLLHLPPGTFAGSALASHGWQFCREDGTDFPRDQHPTRRALATGKIQPEQVIGLMRPNEPVQWLAVCAAPLCHPGEDQPYAAVQTFADITERKETEAARRQAEERMRRLYELSVSHDLTTTADRMNALLRLGCECFGFPIGVLSRVGGERFEVLHVVSGENLIAAGRMCRTQDTFCARVLKAERPLARQHIGDTDWRSIPAHTEFGLESYLGAPLWVDGQAYGTLCFCGKEPQEKALTDGDFEFVRLMAQWASGELMREETREQIESYNIVLEFQMRELEKANVELEALATLDGLTGIKNRRAFGQRLEEEVARATRYSLPLTLLMLDVDRFKSYNDTFGHPEGDEVLKTVARTLEHCARETDLVARYGGEEFVVLLPQTDRAGAFVIAERIRQAILETKWPHRGITVSIGVAHLLPVVDTGSKLIARADQALYLSKAGGRNQVNLSPDADYSASDYRTDGSGVRSIAF